MTTMHDLYSIISVLITMHVLRHVTAMQ